MTTWIEASGKTLEEAKEAAAAELGVSIDEIQSEVIEEGAKGLFGLGQPKVKIRAALLGAEPPARSDGEETVGQGTGSSAPSQKGASVVAILADIFRAMDFDARAELVSETEEEIEANIEGASEDIGKLIGRHGQTLDALQYLVGIAVNRGDPYKVRVLLDAEGYRERHRQLLEARALDYAKQVKETGNEAVLEPQSARDRRIMHVALADDPEIYTYSEGDGDDRHVVISPKK